VLALGCATAGVVLSILPTGVSVVMTATIYRIGDATLHAVAPGVYSGSGTLVLGHNGPQITAGGSAVVDGAHWVAFCEVAAGGAAEMCRLQSGTETLTARDVWSAGTWNRTYSDGPRVEIAAARGVPVPFPVGR
jgi:hypothetical protein